MIRSPWTTGIEKSTVRIASEFSTSGSGTSVDPWIDGIQEAYDDAFDAGRKPTVHLGEGHYKATHVIKFDSANTFGLFGTGGNRCKITTDNDVAFNLFELNETVQGWMGYLSDFKVSYNGTGVVIKDYNMAELYLRGCELRGDRSHSGLLVYNPTLHDLIYCQIEQCYFLQGTDPTAYQIQFKKPGSYQTAEILMSECFLQPSYGTPAPAYGGIIDVEDDALNRWGFTSCRWNNVGDRPMMNIQGKIGCGGFGGIHPVGLQDDGRTTALSRLIYFHNLGSAHEARVKISGIQIEDNSQTPYYGVWIGSNWDYIQVTDNTLTNFATEAIHLSAGVNKHGRLENNVAVNPFGVIATPFLNTSNYIHIGGTAAGPTNASADYTVAGTGCKIISTGGTGVSITIKDKGGTTISSPGATGDEWLEPEWKINFGAFSAAPTVKVAFQ